MKFSVKYVEICRKRHKIIHRKDDEWRWGDCFFNDEGFGIILNHHKQFEENGVIVYMKYYNTTDSELITYHKPNEKSSKYENGWCFLPTSPIDWMGMDGWPLNYEIKRVHKDSFPILYPMDPEFDSKIYDILLSCAQAWDERKPPCKHEFIYKFDLAEHRECKHCNVTERPGL